MTLLLSLKVTFSPFCHYVTKLKRSAEGLASSQTGATTQTSLLVASSCKCQAHARQMRGSFLRKKSKKNKSANLQNALFYFPQQIISIYAQFLKGNLPLFTRAKSSEISQVLPALILPSA